MRIINLDRDGQRSEFALPNGTRIVCTFRKRKHGGWRLEIHEYPDGTRIKTGGGK